MKNFSGGKRAKFFTLASSHSAEHGDMRWNKFAAGAKRSSLPRRKGSPTARGGVGGVDGLLEGGSLGKIRVEFQVGLL